MKLNSETVNIMDFRQEKFDEQLKYIKDIVTGRNTELSAYINDENGNISDERLERFISDLLEGLINYKHQLYGSIPYEMSDKTRELYECFLYCTIHGVAYIKYKDFLPYTVVRGVKTFSDILDVLYHSFNYDNRQELLYIEQLSYPVEYGDNGFFRHCDIAYEILTGESIMSSFSDEEEKIVSLMQEKIKVQEINYNYDDEEEEEEDYFKQIEKELLKQKPQLTVEEMIAKCEEYDPENELIISDDEKKLCEQAASSQKQWKNTVSDPEKFIAKYLRYREIFFETDHSIMKNDIEKMIDVFLYEQDLAAFSLGDEYNILTYRTKRFTGSLKTEIRKARCM